MLELKEGMILEQDTCDEIHIDLEGNSTSINPHTEHWLIKDITSNHYVLYNLDNQRTWKIDKKDMPIYLLENGKYGISAMFRISKEVA